MENKKIFILIFLLSTSFFIFQHYYQKNVLWDFDAYVLNGRFFFWHGIYFELNRPPLAPFLIGILGGSLISEYLYIILISSLFAYSTYKLSKVLKFNEVIFYSLLLNFSTLTYGLFCGTELLALSLLELTIYFVLKENYESGIFSGLSFLARYTMIDYSILLFFHKQKKKILISILLLFLTVLPWLVYNKIVFGNYFASIADSYAENVKFRVHQPINFFNIILFWNILIFLPFFGIKKFKLKRKNLIMLTILIISIINFILTPMKVIRYLFISILPLAYFSYISFSWKKEWAILLFSIMLISSFIFTFLHPCPAFYTQSIKKLKEMNLTNCSIESNIWVYLNYEGIPASPSVRYDLLEKENNTIFLLYKNTEGFGKTKNILFENENYVISGKCIKQTKPIVYIYLKGLNKTLKLLGENESYGYCDVFFPNICREINKI